jgi:hypothetical protein
MARSTKVPRAVRKAFPAVRTVSDARVPLEITVEPRDRRRGKLKSPADCAMAQACKRQEGADGALVRLSSAFIIDGTHATRYNVPESVRREIVSFDRHGDFQPGRYRLAAVPPGERLGADKRQKPRGKATGTRPRTEPKVWRHITVGVR